MTNTRTGRSATARGAAVSLAALLAGTTLLAGCGGSPSSSAKADTSGGGADVIAQAEKLSGQEQVDFLQKEAKKEGGPLRFYTSWSSNAIDSVVAAFEKQYGIDVEAYRASSQDLSLRISQEAQGNYDKGADFVEMRGQELYQFSQDGSLRGFHGDFDSNITDYSGNGSWTADRLNVIVPCWNTKAVAAADAPKSYDELTSGKWKGKLAIEQADTNWFETLYQYFVANGKTEQQAEQWFRDIVANGKVVKGHTEMQEFIAAGQYALSPDCYTYVTDGQKATGAPTDYSPAVSPAVVQPNGVSILKSAKHPASAALFYRWILTDGQQLLQDSGNTAVTLTDVKDGIPLDIEGFTKDADKWTALYDDILAG